MHEVVSKWRKSINRLVEEWAFRGVWIQEFWLNCNSGKCQKKKIPLISAVRCASCTRWAQSMIWASTHPFFELFYYNGASTRTNKDGQFFKNRKRKEGKKHYYSLFLSNPHNTHRCSLSDHGPEGHVLCCEPRYCCLDCVDSWPLVLFRKEINYMYENDCLNNCLIEKRLSMGDFCVYYNKLY